MGHSGTVDINKSLDGLGTGTVGVTTQGKLFETADSKRYKVTFQFGSVAQSCPTLYYPIDCCTPGFPVHHQLPGFIQTHVHWVGDAIQPSHPLLSPSPPAFSLSGSFQTSHFFASGGQSIGVSASTSVIPMNTQDWSPLGWTGWIFLQSKGLFKSLLQHHSSKASILQCSAVFIVQLSHPYMTTGKIVALTRQNFVGKVMSLLFMLSKLVLTFQAVVFFIPLEGSSSWTIGHIQTLAAEGQSWFTESHGVFLELHVSLGAIMEHALIKINQNKPKLIQTGSHCGIGRSRRIVRVFLSNPPDN